MPKVIVYQHIVGMICLLSLWGDIHCYRFEPNTFTFNNLSECPGSENLSVHVNYTVVQEARNKFDISGVIIFGEFLGGKIDVQIIAQKCDFNLTHCEIFDTFNVRDICRLMDLKDQLWTDFMSQNKLKCPFRKTIVRIEHGIIDLGYIAHLPLSGFTWIFTIKVFHSDTKTRNKRKLIFCMLAQVTVTKSRPDRRKTPKARPTFKPK